MFGVAGNVILHAAGSAQEIVERVLNKKRRRKKETPDARLELAALR